MHMLKPLAAHLIRKTSVKVNVSRSFSNDQSRSERPMMGGYGVGFRGRGGVKDWVEGTVGSSGWKKRGIEVGIVRIAVSKSRIASGERAWTSWFSKFALD